MESDFSPSPSHGDGASCHFSAVAMVGLCLGLRPLPLDWLTSVQILCGCWINRNKREQNEPRAINIFWDGTMVSLPEYIRIWSNPHRSTTWSPPVALLHSSEQFRPAAQNGSFQRNAVIYRPGLTATAEEVKATLSLTRSQIGIPSLTASVGTKWGHHPFPNSTPPDPLVPLPVPAWLPILTLRRWGRTDWRLWHCRGNKDVPVSRCSWLLACTKEGDF